MNNYTTEELQQAEAAYAESNGECDTAAMKAALNAVISDHDRRLMESVAKHLEQVHDTTSAACIREWAAALAPVEQPRHRRKGESHWIGDGCDPPHQRGMRDVVDVSLTPPPAEPEVENDPFIVDLLNQAVASESGTVFATREWEEEEEEKPKEPKVGYPLTGDTTHPKPPPEGPAAGAT